MYRNYGKILGSIALYPFVISMRNMGAEVLGKIGSKSLQKKGQDLPPSLPCKHRNDAFLDV